MAKLAGKISGAVTRLGRDRLGGLCRIWCGAHQLYLAVQYAFVKHVKESFRDPLSHLNAFFDDRLV